MSEVYKPEMHTNYAIRVSSLGRGWSGLDACVFDTSGGMIEHHAAPRYCIGMHVGAPVTAKSRFDGVSRRWLQVPGDMHIVPVGDTVAWEDDGPTQYLGMRLMPSLLRSVAEEMQVDFDRMVLPHQIQFRDNKIEHVVLAIKAEVEEQDSHDRIYADGLGLALAAHLLRRYGRGRFHSVTRGLTPRQVHHVTDYIHDHLSEDLSLAEIASVTGISTSYFKVLFKQSIGLPVHKYVVKCRVERAVELLTSDGVKLSEAALKSGFADQSHMSRCMRRFLGLTPAEVKRSVS